MTYYISSSSMMYCWIIKLILMFRIIPERGKGILNWLLDGCLCKRVPVKDLGKYRLPSPHMTSKASISKWGIINSAGKCMLISIHNGGQTSQVLNKYHRYIKQARRMPCIFITLDIVIFLIRDISHLITHMSIMVYN